MAATATHSSAPMTRSRWEIKLAAMGARIRLHEELQRFALRNAEVALRGVWAGHALPGFTPEDYAYSAAAHFAEATRRRIAAREARDALTGLHARTPAEFARPA